MKNIPITVWLFLLFTSIAIIPPFIFDFIEEDPVNSKKIIINIDTLSVDTNYTYSIKEPISKVYLDKNELNITTVGDLPKVDDIYLESIWYIIIYSIYVILYIIYFCIFVELSENNIAPIYPFGCRYLPTKSGMFYYTINYEYKIIKVYKYKFPYLEHETSIRDVVNLTTTLQKISNDMDAKYFSYEIEELDNWKK